MESVVKHPLGSTELIYRLPRNLGGRGLKSVEEEYTLTKVKAGGGQTLWQPRSSNRGSKKV